VILSHVEEPHPGELTTVVTTTQTTTWHQQHHAGPGRGADRRSDGGVARFWGSRGRRFESCRPDQYQAR
jgi:hypothetical protein